MQKVINFLAVTSFLVSGVVVAGGVYVYQNKEEITNRVKQQVIEAATAGVSDALPGMMGGTPGIPSSESDSPVPSLPF